MNKMKLKKTSLIIQKALQEYGDGKMSVEKAAEIADVTIWKFLDCMKERKIPIRYSLDDIKEDIESVNKGVK